MRAESDPGGTSWWIIEFIGDFCKWREPGQHVGLSRGNLKRTDNPCGHMSVTVLFYIMNSHFNQLYITRGLSPPTSPCPPRGRRQGAEAPGFPTAHGSGGRQGSRPGPGELEPWERVGTGAPAGSWARAGPVQSAEVAVWQAGAVPTGTHGDSWTCMLRHAVPSPEHPVVRVAGTFLPVGARGTGLGSSEPGLCRGLPE